MYLRRIESLYSSLIFIFLNILNNYSGFIFYVPNIPYEVIFDK